MAGKARGVGARDIPDARFRSAVEQTASEMSQSTVRTEPGRAVLSNFVTKSNSIMTGMTGNLKQTTVIGTGILDISLDSSGGKIPPRSIVVVDAESGTSDTLDAIEMTGGELEGAELTLIGTSGNTITITHNFSPSGTQRAILCPGDSDATLSGDEAVDLVYNSTSSSWVLKSVGGGGSGASFPLAYGVDDKGSVSGTVTHSLTASTAHKLQFTATGDCDITITGFGSGGVNAVDFYIEVTQDGTGGHAITVNDAEWIDFPTLSTTASTTSLLACHADGDGNMRAVTLLNAASNTAGASKQLNNLSAVKVNTTIDMNGESLTNVDNLTFAVAGSSTATDYYILQGTNKLAYNVPTGGKHEWFGNEVSLMEVSDSGDFTTVGSILAGTILGITNTSTDPLANGLMTLNGSDVKVYSGGSARNISDMGDILLWTQSHDANGEILILDADGDSSIASAVDDTITLSTTSIPRLTVKNAEVNFTVPITFSAASTATAGNVEILEDSSGNLVYNVTSAQDHLFYANGAKIGKWDATSLEIYETATGAELRLFRDDSSPNDDDILGQVDFDGKDSAGNTHTYARIKGISDDVTSTAENGKIIFGIESNNSGVLDAFTMRTDNSANQVPNFQLYEDDSGTGAIGVVSFYANNSTPIIHEFAAINAAANTTTAGSEDGSLTLQVYANGTAENIIECSGESGTPALGFFGTTPVAQQTVASDTLANLYTALRNSGIIG